MPVRSVPLVVILLVVVFVATAVADVATTLAGLGRGHVELSPGVRWAVRELGVVGLVDVKLLVGLAVWALAAWRGWAGAVLGWAVSVVTGGAVLWNVRVLVG